MNKFLLRTYCSVFYIVRVTYRYDSYKVIDALFLVYFVFLSAEVIRTVRMYMHMPWVP